VHFREYSINTTAKTAINAKYVQTHPGVWDVALSSEGYAAPNKGCPDGLPIE